MIQTIKNAILAGILIGLGVIINLKSAYPIAGALLFSFGLLTIINMGLALYTGKIGFVLSDFKNKMPVALTILLFNFIGISIVILYAIGNPEFVKLISGAAAAKFSKTIPTLFINGCFCGMLIHFAVKNKDTIITIFAVMIFILIGAEHCIADFPFFLYNCSLMSGIKLLSVVLGNSAGAILVEELCSTQE